MIRLSLPLSKSEQSHMTLVDYLSQVWATITSSATLAILEEGLIAQMPCGSVS
jgi:hypothetical protein